MDDDSEFFDPAELAREKQRSRDEDARALASGEKSPEQLQRENGHFSFDNVRISARGAKPLVQKRGEAGPGKMVEDDSGFFDPAERAREKQRSRDEDDRAIASGEKTVEQVQRENGLFSFDPDEVRISIIGSEELE